MVVFCCLPGLDGTETEQRPDCRPGVLGRCWSGGDRHRQACSRALGCRILYVLASVVSSLARPTAPGAKPSRCPASNPARLGPPSLGSRAPRQATAPPSAATAAPSAAGLSPSARPTAPGAKPSSS